MDLHPLPEALLAHEVLDQGALAHAPHVGELLEGVDALGAEGVGDHRSLAVLLPRRYRTLSLLGACSAHTWRVPSAARAVNLSGVIHLQATLPGAPLDLLRIS